MKKIKVGVIGNGFVGEAISFAFSSIADTYIFDIDPLRCLNDIETVHNCDFVFVCVPTPMYKDGSQDISYVDSAFEKASDKPIYILKSTVLPGTTERLSRKYPNFKIIFSPEFLTERSAKLDMLTQSRIILGGDKSLTNKAKTLFSKRFKTKNIIQTDSKTAELTKYMNNTFFATKVSIMNEFKLLCDKIGANWEDALKGFVSDGRIGDSHLNVPGHDGKLGYGGTCFPKDVNALLTFSKKYSIELNSIAGGWATNLKVRPEKDWEKKEGRSISYRNKQVKNNLFANKVGVIVSGYFNPLHVGHLEYFKKSKLLGDFLFVIVNNDLQRSLKGSKIFMNQEERVEIISNIRSVDKVILSIDSDKKKKKTIEHISNNFSHDFDLIFANGGDQKNIFSPEKEICEKLNIRIVDGMGEKIQSSSWLLKNKNVE